MPSMPCPACGQSIEIDEGGGLKPHKKSGAGPDDPYCSGN